MSLILDKKCELCNFCMQRNLSACGTKEEMINRIIEYDIANNSNTLPESSAIPQIRSAKEVISHDVITNDETDGVISGTIDDDTSSNISLDIGNLDETADPFGGFEDGVMLDNPELIYYKLTLS